MGADDAKTAQELELLLGMLLPSLRMPMLTPVGQNVIQRVRDSVAGLEAPPLKGRRAQLLPPGLNQVQPTRILRDALCLSLRSRRRRQLRLATVIRAQVVRDDQAAVGWELRHHLLP